MTLPPRAVLTSAQAIAIAAATLLVFCGFSTAIAIWGINGPTVIDAGWAELMRGIQIPPLTALSLALNVIGGTIASGLIAPVIVAGVSLVRHRLWAAGFLIAASVVSAAAVKLVKVTFARPRPEDMMIVSDFGSFPSGHSANAAVIAIVLCLLFPRQRWLPYVSGAYVLLMMWSRTYLQAHWLTDTVAGVLLGTTAALLIWAGFRTHVIREAQSPALQRSTHT